jgi:hypothetical protein
MATSLSSRLIEIAKSLKTTSRKVRWGEILTVLHEAGELTDDQRREAEQIGLKKVAKWAAKVAVPGLDLFGWSGGNIPDPDGGRVASIAADIANYDWAIEEADKAIVNWTRRRDKLIRERDALIAQSDRA